MQPSRRATGCGGHLVLSSVLFLLLVPSAHAFTPATPRQRRAAAPLHHHQRSPAPAMGWETTRPSVLLRLGAFGAGVGPFVDAVHNQALLQYDVLPVEVQLVDARTSALVPPLLFLAYAILGGVGPAIAEALLPSRDDDDAPASAMAARGRATTALLAVASTIGIIKLSELLVLASVPPAAALALLLSLCALQWRLLDGRASSVALAALAAVGGPLAELPIMAAGAWHYVSPDYFPLAAFGVDPAVGWSGLASITAPCYFAVTTDAIALGRWFSEGIEVGEG